MLDKDTAWQAPIGVLDSGVGGIGVLAEALARLPRERFCFLGDLAHAPYGGRSRQEIAALAGNAAQRLAGQGIKALVVACNTATSAAIEELRERFPFPVIGMEPALKPAIEHGQPRRKIVVMATPATLRLDKFQRLLDRYADCREQVLEAPCPGLSLMVEREGPGSPAVRSYLHELFDPMDREEIGAVVLGCTHYTFLKADIHAVLGEQVALYDGNAGTIRQLERQLAAADLLAREPLSFPEGRVRILPSRENAQDEALLRRFLDLARTGT